MKRFFGILLLLGALIGAFFAVQAIFWQDRAVREFVPVDANITKSELYISRGKSTTYSADIEYTYQSGGRQFRGHKVYPFQYSSNSRSAADKVLQQYPAGRPATAYIDPQNPKDAILIREYQSVPYFLALITLFIALFGMALTLNLTGTRKEMGAVALDDSGWKLLLPTRNLRLQFLTSILWAAGWGVESTPVIGHWLLRVGMTRVSSYMLTLGAGSFLALQLVFLFRRWSLSRHLSDVRLRVKPAPMQRGEVFAIEAEADAHSPLRVSKMTAKVTCIEHYREKSGNKTQYGQRVRGNQELQLCGAVQIAAGQVVEGKGEVFFPKESWPPTTDISAIKTYPHFTWLVRVDIALEGMVDYRGDFPLEVD